MARSHRSFGLFIVVLAFLCWLAPAAGSVRGTRASIRESLMQCHSGTNGAGPCTFNATGNLVNGWAHGNINHTNSLYRSGDFVPFRTVLTGLHDGSEYRLRILYRAVASGLHAYDYLGSYDGSIVPRGLLEAVVPCGGVGDTERPDSCGEAPSTLAIPVDSRTAFPQPPLPGGTGSQLQGAFSAWGATLVQGSAEYVNPSRTEIVANMSTTVSVQRELEFTFHANGPTAVLAWGAHIATPLDWGFGRTEADAGSGSGGFHLGLVSLNGNSIGGQHETMNQNAIAQPPTISTGVSPGSVVVGQQVTDTATLTARSSQFPVTGRVHFFVCGPAAAGPPDCSRGGTEVAGSPQVVNGDPNAAASVTFRPNAAGHWCFRVLFVPSAEAGYSTGTHTNRTSECFVVTPRPTQLIVTKLCDPESDPGLFNLFVSGAPFGGATNVPCGHVEGPRDVSAGTHQVSETAGAGTSLADYTTTFGGNCNAAGQVTVPQGRRKVCVITNVRKPLVEGSLTVTKVCSPANDSGLFEIRVGGEPVAVLACGESTVQAVGLAPGTYTLSEVGVAPTDLTDYTTTIVCNGIPGASITIVSNQTVSCTVTNTRIPPRTTVQVDKACKPANDSGRFNLTIDGSVAGTGANVRCGGTTGPVNVSPGDHKVGETAGTGTDLGHYTVVIEGDCAADGTVTVTAGEHGVCLITNVRTPLKPPPPPREVCYTLTVKPQTVKVGRRVRVVARVHVDGRPVPGVRVYLRGPRISAIGTTGRTGRAVFVLRPRRRGLLHVTIRKAYLCPKHPPRKVGILGVRTPPITG